MPQHQHQLTYELHGVSEDGTDVITVQRWEGRPGSATLVVARNGYIVRRRPGRLAAVNAELEQAKDALHALQISDRVARALLAARDVGDNHCTRCGALFPIGAWRCRDCGMSVGQHAAGSQSGAARRGGIAIRVSGQLTP